MPIQPSNISINSKVEEQKQRLLQNLEQLSDDQDNSFVARTLINLNEAIEDTFMEKVEEQSDGMLQDMFRTFFPFMMCWMVQNVQYY